MKTSDIVKRALLGEMVIVGGYFYFQLPAQVPLHRNINGIPDGRGDKTVAVALLPLIVLVLIGRFPLQKKIDPKKEQYRKFEKTREILQLGIIAFLAYTYFISLYVIFHPEVNIGKWMLIGLGVLFILL